MPRNVILQRTIPCTSHPEPRSNATRDLNRLRLPHTGGAAATQRHTATYPSLHQPPRATLQRYRMLQSPATKSRTGAAPATQRHAATHMQRIPCTLQRYQDASIDCAYHQMSHWCCATASHCNAPFPAPATQSHPTLPGCFNHLPPNVTLVLRLPHNVTLQRTIPCSHPEPRSNATRMLQSTAPATKCHTGAAPATQRHNSTCQGI